ncbi:unnamed protein product [Paramecium octaurelia]|uniref:Uncharacterized protein n=1 Tax=Paramecium octaurelia TaxID=43137 RepID=A0A8S1XAF5_PAROT|nr:unnamed protein product [Paramecium octaurelia]CAD8215114.1 unnamed protein product [Paramecium octaurelia]
MNIRICNSQSVFIGLIVPLFLLLILYKQSISKFLFMYRENNDKINLEDMQDIDLMNIFNKLLLGNDQIVGEYNYYYNLL